MSTDPKNAGNHLALGRRGFLGAAAALGGTAALAPMAMAAPADKPTPLQPKPPKGDPLPSPSVYSLVPISEKQITDAITKDLDDIIKRVQAMTGVPGIAAAVVYKGEVRFMEGYGTADKIYGNRVKVDTVFQLASVSKPLAASAVAHAIDDKLRWDDPVVKYLPDFAVADPYVTTHLTIEDMLSHRSGLPGAAGDLLEDLGYDQARILNRLRLDPLAPMRTKFAYSNFGFTAGAVAAAKAKGQSWPDFADVNLFRPLGMTQASYRYSDFLGRGNHTAMHVRDDKGEWVQRFFRNPDPEAPAGGATASIRDMANWLQMQLANGVWNGKPFIDAGALARTHQPAILLAPPNPAYARSSFYGLGWDIGVDAAGLVRWSHSGAFFQGASTQVLMVPALNLGIVVLTNGMPIGVPESISAYFLDQVEARKATRDWLTGYGAVFADSMVNRSALAGKTPPANPTPAKALPFYTGTYQNPFYGPVTVDVAGGSLHLHIGPDGKNDYPMTHWDGNVFSFFPTGENALGITAATFAPATGSQATSLTLEYYNAEGLGVFTR